MGVRTPETCWAVNKHQVINWIKLLHLVGWFIWIVWWCTDLQTLKILKVIFVKTCFYKGKAIPWQAWIGPEGSRRLRLPDFMTISTQKWQDCQPWLATFTPQEIFLVLISVRDWVNPTDIVRLERLRWWKIPVTSSWTIPATFSFECLNQLCHHMPPKQAWQKEWVIRMNLGQLHNDW